MAATLEELEQRVADLEEYVEEQSVHTLAYSAEQIDAFFATLDARILSAGSKDIVVTQESVYKDVKLTASDLGVTNVTSDIKLVCTVHALNAAAGDFYHYALTVAVLGPYASQNSLVLRISEQMPVTYASNYVPKLSEGTYRINWLRIG